MPTNLPSIRPITSGPKHHWFGYYDKLQFDPSGRYVLGMEVDFEHRSPRPEDTIVVGMIDLAEGDRWIELGTSRAWCWQQGCMLQWRPGSQSEVVWNDRDGDHFVCRILDVATGKQRTVPFPIYTLSPDGKQAVTPDFRRIADTRPGYGYNGIPDPDRDVLAPEDAGIWRVDLESGAYRLIISLAQMLDIPWPHGDIHHAKHWFNHLLWNPDGSRFEFLHRWLSEGRARPADPHAHGQSRRQRHPRARRLRAYLALHLARPGATSWPGRGTRRTAMPSTSTTSTTARWRSWVRA